jgi:hypothetical protein
MGALVELDDVLAGGTSVFSVLCLFVIRGGGASFSVSTELVPSQFLKRWKRYMFVVSS